MKTKYEELPMIEEKKTGSVHVSNKSMAMEESSIKSSSTEQLTTMESVPESPCDTNESKEGNKDEEEDEQHVLGEEDEDLKSKYVKLIEHNSKLVDLLKTTMQIQTDMFRKLIHYVFP